MSDFLDFRASFEERSSSGGSFDGVRIPFFSVAEGKTRLRVISELPIHEANEKVPNIRFYRYYKPEPNGSHNGKPAYIFNGKPTWEFAYHPEDDIEEGYVAAKRKDGKKIEPRRFPWKGFAYIQNLTGIKAVQAYQKNGKVTSADFNRDPNETAAAKVYVQEYLEALENHNKRREELLNADEPKDIGEFNYHGIFIYNFPLTVAKQINLFISSMEADDYELDDIKLSEWVFALTKTGKGMQTEYGFMVDYPVDEVREEVLSPTQDFLDSLEEGLSDFEGLVDRKRYRDPEELDEDVKISNMKDEEKVAAPAGDWR